MPDAPRWIVSCTPEHAVYGLPTSVEHDDPDMAIRHAEMLRVSMGNVAKITVTRSTGAPWPHPTAPEPLP